MAIKLNFKEIVEGMPIFPREGVIDSFMDIIKYYGVLTHKKIKSTNLWEENILWAQNIWLSRGDWLVYIKSVSNTISIVGSQ